MSGLREAAQAALTAWDDPTGMPAMCEAMDALRAALAQDEPTCKNCGDAIHPNFPCAEARALREPTGKALTDQQIDAIADGIPVDDVDGSPLAASRWHVRLARAIERHYGIGGNE